MNEYRILMISGNRELQKRCLVLLEQQVEIYEATSIQDALSHLSVCSYHLVMIALQQEPEIICQLVETIRKIVITPMIVLLSEHTEIRSKIIRLGADAVLIQPYAAEEINLQAYALIRRYAEWKSEKKRNSYQSWETGNFSISKNGEMGASNCPRCKKRV